MKRVVAAVVSIVWLASPLSAHHSGSEYDLQNVVEISGTLVELAWQNPHVHFGVRTTDARGTVNPVGHRGEFRQHPASHRRQPGQLETR